MIEELRNELKEQIKENQELLKINEEHQKINGELRKEIDGLVTVIDLAKEKIESTRIYSLRNGKTLVATLLNDILEILERVNEE